MPRRSVSPAGRSSALKLLLKNDNPEELLVILNKVPLTLLKQWLSHVSIEPAGNRHHKSSYASPLFAYFWSKYTMYSCLQLSSMRTLIATMGLNRAIGSANSHRGLVYCLLQSEFPHAFLKKLLYVAVMNQYTARRARYAENVALAVSTQATAEQDIIDSWPQPIDPLFSLSCCKAYVDATNITPRLPCVSCGRAFFVTELTTTYTFSFDDVCLPTAHPLCILRDEYTEPTPTSAQLSDICSILDDISIHHEYVEVNREARNLSLRICAGCASALESQKIPKFSLSNNLYRGSLPVDLRDITWIEEKVCALHRVTADVARLQNAEADERLPYRLVGNTCAYPVNVPSTARVLPRIPADINENLTVVFVGATFARKQLPPMFRVRRRVIERFLAFLAANNPLYSQVEISADNLNLYPDDDVLPLLEESVIVNNSVHPTTTLAEETASFEPHPAHLSSQEPASELPATSAVHHATGDVDGDAVIETTGVIDFKGSTLSGHSATASALFNLIRPRRTGDQPDLILPRGHEYVNDYDNPSLFPGMFPTLFPFGTGGLEADRLTPISFQEHANYLLSLHDPSFKHHRLFLFIALSIIKKRKGHLHTAFTVKKHSFSALADVLSSISAETLESTAQHLQQDKPFSDFTPEQKHAFSCLQQLNIASAGLPGSPASKLNDRAAIRGYFGLFGLPHIYMTMNPSAAHSPVLQVFFGDTQVDLSSRYPSMPLPEARAKRIAKDPVAAADFFVFCIKMFLKHLLGYDSETGCSTGGILGHVKCYYGKCECTMRGCLHGHLVLWLLGGLNPREVHHKLEHDKEFKRRFFEFWEQIIKHDAPYDDIAIPSTSSDVRTQRPPPCDDPLWDSTFQYDVKVCAEALQRHSCQDVCWKYSNVKHLPRELRPCRFQFPHEIVEESHYDPKTKSVVMACRDGTMNFHNPHLLVFCRHNHDIKNIASGKSAKAAMFYITNYITKDDLHSHQILSMMAASITHMKEDETASNVDRAKARLQRWVSQLSRLQEVHAQMAVLYIRGVGDTFASHATVPMLSRALLHHLRLSYPNTPTIEPSNDDEVDDDTEPVNVSLRRTRDGSFFTDPNQVEDYIHRDDKLMDLSFYQFVCCIRKEKGKLTISTRLNSSQRFPLRAPHPQNATHVLLMHQDWSLPLHKWKTPPRILGMQVPRKNSSDYPLFMLGHFKPFSIDAPLVPHGSSYAMELERYEFSPEAGRIMQNWEDVHECEDERDADRIRKKANVAEASVAFNAKLAAMAQQVGDEDDEDGGPLVSMVATDKLLPAHTQELLSTLLAAGWFKGKTAAEGSSLAMPSTETIGRPSAQKIKEWKGVLKVQEEDVRRQRNNSADSRHQMEYSSVQLRGELPSTVAGTAAPDISIASKFSTRSKKLPETVLADSMSASETSQQLIQRIGDEMTLNEEQWKAYLMVARKFVSDVVAIAAKERPARPLRLLLTGPGGTGKSHVVNTLKKLMDAYGMSHKLRLMAPTGSAASLIDATTIHKGLGILVRRKKDPKNINADNVVALEVSKKRRTELEREWRPAEWLFCDECSLVGATLIAELDQMLRLVKDCPDWYGGINIVFAGDFSQYAPVQATPLYEPIGPTTGSKTNQDYLKRMGRLAWLAVDSIVELTEQRRMFRDPVYGEAVSRLRMRRCNQDDLALFNSRVVASYEGGSGVRLRPDQSAVATTIVRDNKTRLLLNSMKATALVEKSELIVCAARDFKSSGEVLEGKEQDTHLLFDFASLISSGGLPSFIPLAVGMTVVLRTRNISSDLKISNGSVGVVIALFSSSNGEYRSADGAVVHFPASPVKLPGLPPGCIFLQPESKPYSIIRDGVKVSFRREQMLVEPAYAVTGHFSQGKTLPVVVADLKNGGPAAYVAASRPTERDGLFLVRKLTLKDLNHPPHPPNLLREFARFEAIKHNTLVDHGFLKAPRRVLTHDGIEGSTEASASRMEWMPSPEGTRKRKAGDTISDESVSTAMDSPLKRPKKSETSPVRGNQGVDYIPPNPYALPFLAWDGRNYSCAYDSLLTPLYAAWVAMTDGARLRLQSVSNLLQLIGEDFSATQRSPLPDQGPCLRQARENLRDRLALSPESAVFPRSGPALISLDDLIEKVGLSARLEFAVDLSCSSCGVDLSERHGRIKLHYMFYDATIGCLGPEIAAVVDVQEWSNAQLATGNLLPAARDCQCLLPRPIRNTTLLNCDAPPSVLIFHTFPISSTRLRPTANLSFTLSRIAGQEAYLTYRLFAVIYYGRSHFTARILHNSHWWNYDGMAPCPTRFASANSANAMESLNERNGLIATHFFYFRPPSSTSESSPR